MSTIVKPVDISDTITLGGAAQVLSAAKGTPRKLRIRNESTETLYISLTGTATTASFGIRSGEYYESPYATKNAISILGATTGSAFFAEEWYE
jgi:hypothetical protein